MRTPKNVVTVLEDSTESFDVVVLMVGYDSSAKKIEDEYKDLIEVVDGHIVSSGDRPS
jgi:hypothetical protein